MRTKFYLNINFTVYTLLGIVYISYILPSKPRHVHWSDDCFLSSMGDIFYFNFF